MSGIVGSYFNTRGSGVVAKLGTDGQVFTSTGAGLSQGFEAAAGGGGLLQLKTAVKTDVFTSTSTSMVDVTDLTVDITPTASDSKILILVSYKGSLGIVQSVTNRLQLVRDTTVILALGNIGNASSAFMQNNHAMFLDNPATTSATTYKIQGKGDGQTWSCNQVQGGSTDESDSTITVMEIATGVL